MGYLLKKLFSFFYKGIQTNLQKKTSISRTVDAYREAYENKEFMDDLYHPDKNEESDRDFLKLPAWFTNAGDTSLYLDEFLNAEYDGYSHFVSSPSYRRGLFFILKESKSRRDFNLSWPIDLSLPRPKEPKVFNLEESGVLEIIKAPLDTIKKMYMDKFVQEESARDARIYDNNYLKEFVKHKDRQWYEEEALKSWQQYGEKEWRSYKSLALDCKKNYQRINTKNLEIFQKAKAEFKKSEACVITLAKLTMRHNEIPVFFEPNFKFNLDETEEFLQVQFDFADYNDVDFGKLSETAKKKIVKNSLFSMIIWVGHVLGTQLRDKPVKHIGINVHQSWFNPATGQPASGIIASVMAATDHLASLNIERLDPVACIRDLKGIVTPSLEKQSPIKPIFTLNTDDSRFIESQDIDSSLLDESNLAAMPWEDFEQLVRQLFAWEYANNGVAVEVTKASRDRGVDAILLDPDPIRGGKYVIQAKCYTRTVDVAAVRDLYGTVMNEGANRGILITTSSYGPDAYEFAKDKPISLIDGPNLIEMLRKHGRNYRIDLEEARAIKGISEN